MTQWALFCYTIVFTFIDFTLPYICHDTKKLSSSPSRPHPYPSKIYKFKNKVKTNKQTKKHLEAVGNYGENQRGIWRKEEVWIGPTVFYNHFAKTDFTYCELCEISLCRTYSPLINNFWFSILHFYNRIKGFRSNRYFNSILTTFRLNSFPKYSKRVQMEQTLWDVIIIHHKRLISICEIIRIKLLKAKNQDSPFVLKYNRKSYVDNKKIKLFM